MANKTKCQTPEAQFHITIKDKKISCIVDLPMSLDLSEEEAEILDINIHNVMELVLARYFINPPKNKTKLKENTVPKKGIIIHT